MTIAWPGPVDAGALDQCHRQSVLWLPGLRPKAAASPGPSTAVRTSSRRGRTTRSAIARARCSISRRRHRRPVVPDRAADPRPRGDLCRPSWPRLQPLRTYRARHRQRLLQFVPPGDPIKISRLTLQQHNGPRAAPLGLRLCRMGARRLAGGHGRRSCDRDGRCDRRDVRAQSVERGVRAAASPSWTSADARPDWTGDRREFIGRNGTLASRRAGVAAPLSRPGWRRPRPLRRVADHGRAAARHRGRDRVLPRRRCRCAPPRERW